MISICSSYRYSRHTNRYSDGPPHHPHVEYRTYMYATMQNISFRALAGYAGENPIISLGTIRLTRRSTSSHLMQKRNKKMCPPINSVCQSRIVQPGAHGWRGREMRYWILNLGIPYRKLSRAGSNPACMYMYGSTEREREKTRLINEFTFPLKYRSR